MITITTKANYLAAAAVAVATRDSRYFLKGVALQSDGADGLNIISTDGHRLIRLHDSGDSFKADKGDERDKFIIDLSKPAVAELRKAGNRGEIVIISIELGATICEISLGGISFSCDIIDGQFPDWRRVIPTPGPGPAAISEIGFNSRYLADLHTVAKLLSTGGKNAKDAPVKYIPIDGGSGQIFKFLNVDAKDAIMVIMPMRLNEK